MRSVYERIEEFNKGLLPAKVARKYELLTSNAFSFFRGTNHIFYEDLVKAALPESPVCWICGDLHLENYGSFKGDNRLVYFDLNDFDESILAPVIWDVVRLITSIFIAFDSLNITDEEARKAAGEFLKKYSHVLSQGKPRYVEAKVATGIVKQFLTAVEERSEDALLNKRTRKIKGKLQLSNGKKKQLAIHAELKSKLIAAFKPWMKSNNAPPNNYKVLDVRFRLAGTGSLGVRRYVFLIQKISDKSKHMLIDMKEATSSSLAIYDSIPQPGWKSEAERITTVQKIMQNIHPAQLSTLSFEGNSYVMQEMQPTKDRINFEQIEDNFKDVCNVIEDMALIAASAHLRTTGRKGTCLIEDLMEFGKNDTWQEEVIKYAESYKKIVVSDYKEFKQELANRRSKD